MDLWTLEEALTPWLPDAVLGCWGFVDRWVIGFLGLSIWPGSGGCFELLCHVFWERSNSKIGLCMRLIDILFHCSIRIM
jgi:hypothetical protein